MNTSRTILVIPCVIEVGACVANDDKDEDDDADDDDDVDDDKYAEYKEYSIGALLDKRDTDDGDEYLVHWRGFDDDDDSWEPEEAIPKKMIQRFLALSKSYDDKYKKKTLGIQEVNSFPNCPPQHALLRFTYRMN